MQSPYGEPLTAEWPLPSVSPWRDALLRDRGRLPTQHGRHQDQDPEPEPEPAPAHDTEASSTSASAWTINIKSRGIDSLIKLDFSSQASIENSLDGAMRQLRQLGLQQVVQHGVLPGQHACSREADQAAADILYGMYKHDLALCVEIRSIFPNDFPCKG